MCASGMLTKTTILSLSMLAQGMFIKKMNTCYPELINYREDFLLQSQGK